MTNAALDKSEKEFGHYALPAAREAIRASADQFSDTKLGRWRISYARKKAFKNLPDPFDVEFAPGVKARLWPRSSRCEKRVFAGHQVWDKEERAALLSALILSDRTPFVFLDVGANVGLYSLLLAATAKAQNIKTRILAIEPDATNKARLLFNVHASDADIDILPVAISDQRGSGTMIGGDSNRGEAHLEEASSGENTVKIETLHSICKSKKLSHIDAMKVDIEGHDLKALSAFFSHAPQTLWPNLLILETGREPLTPLLELCTSQGYTITKRAGINSILQRAA